MDQRVSFLTGSTGHDGYDVANVKRCYVLRSWHAICVCTCLAREPSNMRYMGVLVTLVSLVLLSKAATANVLSPGDY